jgi:hypothetical protein
LAIFIIALMAALTGRTSSTGISSGRTETEARAWSARRCVSEVNSGASVAGAVVALRSVGRRRQRSRKVRADKLDVEFSLAR